jgi:hypothetical protein
LKIRTSRRPRAALALAAAVAVGLSTFAALPAAAVELDVSDAVFTWGISNEANNRAFAPGTYNFFSAGQAPKTSGADTISESEWSATAGDVTIQKQQADGSYATATWAGLKTTPTGGAIGSPSAGKFTGHRVSISHGEGSLDPVADNAAIAWEGSFTVAFYSGMTQFYVGDPKLTVTAGVGTLTGTLSGYGTSMEDPEVFEQLPTREVTLATLSSVDVTETGVTVTPDYDGVAVNLPESATPQSTAGAWGSFPQSFVDYQLLTGQSSYWYSSGGSTDAFKKALPLGVSYTAEPAVLTPVITTQPVASSVALGETATFTVAATSPATLSYQWQKSPDGATWSAIAGATNASYSVVGNSDTAVRYRVIVTANGEAVTSSAVALTVAVAAPTVVVSKSGDVDPAGETVTVTGSGFVPNGSATNGARPPLAGSFSGAYVAFGKYADVWKPSVSAPSSARNNSDVKWAVPAASMAGIGGAAGGAVELRADGTFETTLVLKKGYNNEPATGNFGVYTYSGSGAKYAGFETYTPVTFAAVAPSAPAKPTATVDGTGVTVGWAAPADGGSAITGYTVSLVPSSGAPITQTVAAAETSVLFANLVRGESYTATVTASNAVGSSSASAASDAAVIAALAPSAPAAPTVTATSTTSVNVAWAAPAANGSAITGYSVVVSAGGTVVSTTPVEAGTTSTTITGLTRATDYSVTVSATNAVGTSEASAASTVRTPAEAPTAVGAPVASVVTGTSVNVAWTAPADGGSAVTGYTVAVLQGGSLVKTVNATGTSVLVEGLTSGTTYTFTVAATNAAGTGAASAASTAVTTFAVASAPSAPTAALAGDTGIEVSWAAPSTTGGTPITGYTVTLSTGGSIVSSQNVSASTLTTSFSALLPGKSYTAQVTANNSVGSSAVSDASVPVTIPATAPAAPAAPQASVSGTDVTIAWATPASTGGSAITGYVVTLMSGGAVVDTKTVGEDALSASFTGLDYSTSYSATVVAVNAVGSSEASAASGSVLTGDPTAAPETVVVGDDLSEESQNGLTLDPGTVPQGSSVTVGGLDAGEWYFVTAFSEPVQLGWFQASADGEILVSLAGVEAGAHRLAVQNIEGELVGWAGVTVTTAETVAPVGGAAPITGAGSTTPTGAATRLPNTGLEVGGWIALSSILVLGGFAALMLRRGRRHGKAVSAD